MNATFKSIEIKERSSRLYFLLSFFLPLFQISIVAIAVFNNDAYTLYQTVIAVFTYGLIGDLIGLVFAMRGMRNHGDSKCFYPLLLNLFFAIPKVLIIYLYHSMV